MSPRLAPLVAQYVERVVNRRDLSAVDDLVSPSYVGSGPGWPTDVTALRRFYEDQYRDRPDWRIDVQETVEVGASVVVRARAGGSAAPGGQQRRLEWLTRYRLSAGLIVRIDVLEVVDLDAEAPTGAADPGPPTRP